MHDRLRDLLRRRHLAAIGLVAVTVPALGGCAATSSPQPTPLPAPSLTQEQQDDKAFEDLFSTYASLDPNVESENDLRGLLTGNALEGELASMAQMEKDDQHPVGLATSRGFTVTSRGKDDDGVKFMVGQACLDVSGTRILDSAGNDVTPARDDLLSLQMKATRSVDGHWLISESLRNEAVHACG